MAERAWAVEPSGPLRGDVSVRGSKNAVTKHMVAAVLGDGTSVIRHAPEVGDVQITADILRSLGVDVDLDEGSGTIRVEPGPNVKSEVPLSFSGLNRIPILMIGPLLHRTGEAFVPLVGGDPIGRRPVDFHIAALRHWAPRSRNGPTALPPRRPGSSVPASSCRTPASAPPRPCC